MNTKPDPAAALQTALQALGSIPHDYPRRRNLLLIARNWLDGQLRPQQRGGRQ